MPPDAGAGYSRARLPAKGSSTPHIRQAGTATSPDVRATRKHASPQDLCQKTVSQTDCPADPDLVFGKDVDGKYESALKKIGIDLGMLSNEAGHA